MIYWVRTVSACAVCHSVKCCCNIDKSVSIADVIRFDTNCPRDFRFVDADTDTAQLSAFTAEYKTQLDAELVEFGDRIINMNGTLQRVTSEPLERTVAFGTLNSVSPWIEEQDGLSRYTSASQHEPATRVAHLAKTAAIRIREFTTTDREATSWASCPRTVAESAAGYEAMKAWCDMQLLVLGYRL